MKQKYLLPLSWILFLLIGFFLSSIIFAKLPTPQQVDKFSSELAQTKAQIQELKSSIDNLSEVLDERMPSEEKINEIIERMPSEEKVDKLIVNLKAVSDAADKLSYLFPK